MKSNIQFLTLLQKQLAASRTAAQMFDAADRKDLKDKEEAQMAVLEEYASGVETVGEEDIARMVRESLEKMRAEGQKLDTGSVLKSLLGPAGPFEGQPVEKGKVARIVKDMLQS